MKRLLITILCLVAVISFAGVSQWMQGVIARKNAGGGAPAWAPTDVSGLFGWWKADAGVLESDLSAAEAGDVVTNWEDQSGGGNNLTNGQNNTFQTSPTRIVSEEAAVFFDPAVIVASVTNVFIVAHNTSDSPFMFIDYNNSSYVGAAQDGSGAISYAALVSPPTYYSNLVSVGTSRDNVHDAWSIGSTIVSTARNWVDEQTDWQMFTYPAGAGFGYTGAVYEVIWYTNTISDADFTNAVNYLNGRW